MRKIYSLIFLMVVSFFFGNEIKAQDACFSQKLIEAPDKFFKFFGDRAERMQQKLDKQTKKYLAKFEKQENRIRKKLYKKDSLLAKQVFAHSNDELDKLANKDSLLTNKNVYLGHLDSLQTALKFIEQQKLDGKVPNSAVQQSLDQYRQLQKSLNQSEALKKYIKQRQATMRTALQQSGMSRQLKKYQKDAWYYSAQVQECKAAFQDADKLEKKLMQLVFNTPQFKNFFAKNSGLASLFALPGAGSTQPLNPNLQTRAMFAQSIADRFGSSAQVKEQLRQQMNAAQNLLNQLKAKANSYTNGSYGNGQDKEMPNFKPNNQKTKSLIDRLELGTNFQSQKARYYFPATANIGLSLGYKINDNAIAGIGAAYKLGLGTGWNNIHFSNEGVSLRSFIDYKLKKSLFLTAGYEQNYLASFGSVQQLKNYSAWQSSGLAGLSKRYNAGKKLKGEMKLMWDFLSYQQMPRAQAVVFRIGYNLK